MGNKDSFLWETQTASAGAEANNDDKVRRTPLLTRGKQGAPCKLLAGISAVSFQKEVTRIGRKWSSRGEVTSEVIC